MSQTKIRKTFSHFLTFTADNTPMKTKMKIHSLKYEMEKKIEKNSFPHTLLVFFPHINKYRTGTYGIDKNTILPQLTEIVSFFLKLKVV